MSSFTRLRRKAVTCKCLQAPPPSSPGYLLGYGVAYGNRWVAVGLGFDANGRDGKNIYWSDDGITWNAVSGPFGKGGGGGVAYGDRWVAVGFGVDTKVQPDGKNIYYSDDGIKWTAVPGPFGKSTDASNNTFTVAYGNRWVAIGLGIDPFESGVKNIYYSDDGITWTGVSGQFGSTRQAGLAYDGEKWIATAGDNYTSSDGIIWKALLIGNLS